MRLTDPQRPFRQIGAASQRKQAQRWEARTELLKRSNRKCELCGHWQSGLDGHHVFRRGATAGIPADLCESPELMLVVCRSDPRTGRQGCHERIHAGDADLINEARSYALARFADKYDLRDIDVDWNADPLEVMRELVRELEARA